MRPCTFWKLTDKELGPGFKILGLQIPISKKLRKSNEAIKTFKALSKRFLDLKNEHSLF
jgi:hypothetical protein